MAELELELVNEKYQGRILGQRFEFPAHPENKYCLIHFLRGFKKPSINSGRCQSFCKWKGKNCDSFSLQRGVSAFKKTSDR